MDNRAARRRAATEANRAKARSARMLAGSANADRGHVGVRGLPAGPGFPSEAYEPEALVVSHAFDPGDDGDPYSATVRLTGRRIGVLGARTSQDDVVQEDRIEGVLPGTGPVSITSWVYGLHPGEWAVEAELLPTGAAGRHAGGRASEALRPATWSWRRWTLSNRPSAPVKTRWAMLAPLARMPGVVPGSWPALGALGVLVALLTLSAILAHERIPIGPSLAGSLVALASGMAGAKLWYAVLHPGPWRQAILGGWAVDGFLVVAPVAAVVTLLALSLPVGVVLDAAAPGLFFAVAIGRIGCFLTGCCAGRVTSSRWGIWSSDRRIGARRVPAQLLESAAGAIIGLASALLVVVHRQHLDGAIFVGGFVVYLGVRQSLLRLRAERREFLWRRRAAAMADLA